MLILTLTLILNLILLLQEHKKDNEVNRMVLVGDAKVYEYYGFLRSDSREWSNNHDHGYASCDQRSMKLEMRVDHCTLPKALSALPQSTCNQA